MCTPFEFVDGPPTAKLPTLLNVVPTAALVKVIVELPLWLVVKVPPPVNPLPAAIVTVALFGDEAAEAFRVIVELPLWLVVKVPPPVRLEPAAIVIVALFADVPELVITPVEEL